MAPPAGDWTKGMLVYSEHTTTNTNNNIKKLDNRMEASLLGGTVSSSISDMPPVSSSSKAKSLKSKLDKSNSKESAAATAHQLVSELAELCLSGHNHSKPANKSSNNNNTNSNKREKKSKGIIVCQEKEYSVTGEFSVSDVSMPSVLTPAKPKKQTKPIDELDLNATIRTVSSYGSNGDDSNLPMDRTPPIILGRSSRNMHMVGDSSTTGARSSKRYQKLNSHKNKVLRRTTSLPLKTRTNNTNTPPNTDLKPPSLTNKEAQFPQSKLL